jgi:O-antigen/teichoic acid export membrane protein
VLRLSLAVGLLGATLGLGARLAVPDAFASLTVGETALVVAGLPFSLTWFYVSFIALATDRYEAYVLPPALQSALALVLVAPGALAWDITGAVAGLTLANVIVGLSTAVWAGRRLPAQEGDEAQPPMLRKAIAFGVKGYAANALQLLNYRLDLFILSAVASAAAVGRYAVAVAVTQVLWLLPQGLSDVLFPRVAQLSARDDSETHREMVEVKSLRHVTLTVAVSAVVLALALLLLVVPIYGESFRESIDLGLILLPGVALIGVSGVLSATIVGRGKPIYSLYIALITTPLTIGLYAVLIPALDAKGAAIASSASYAASFVLACLFYARVTGRNPLPLMRPGRSELEDLRALPRAVAAWARGLAR